MAAVRTVAADRSLPHQIVLRTDGRWKVWVTCNCRIRRGLPHFGELKTGEETPWPLYAAGPHDLRDGPLQQRVTGERATYKVA